MLSYCKERIKYKETEWVLIQSYRGCHSPFCLRHTVGSATHTHTLMLIPSVPHVLSSMNTFFHPSIHLSLSFIIVMLSFTSLLLPSSTLFSSHFCQSLFPPPFITPFSVLMPLFLCPSLLLFIHHHSLRPSLPPSLPFFHLSLPLTMRGVMEIGWESRRGRKLQVWVETERAVRRGEAREGQGREAERKQEREWVKTTAWEKDRETTRDYTETVQICIVWHMAIHSRVQHSTNNNANHNMHKRTWWDAAYISL